MKVIIIDKKTNEKARFFAFDSISEARANNFKVSEKNFLNDFCNDFVITETISDYKNQNQDAFDSNYFVTKIKINRNHRVFSNDDFIDFEENPRSIDKIIDFTN